MVTRRVPLPLLPVEIDRERRDRGVTLEQWYDAPEPPLKRWECEDPSAELELRDVRTGGVELVPARPCPALRCKHHLGLRGAESCRLDVAARPAAERTLADVGDAMGVQFQKVHQIEQRVFKRNQRDIGDGEDVPTEQELAIRLGLARRPAGRR